MEIPVRKHRPNPFAVLVLVVLAVFTLYNLGKYVRGLIYGFPDPLGLRAHSSPSPSVAPSAVPAQSSAQPLVQPSGRSSAQPAALEEGLWKAFGARFGQELKVERSPSGRVAAVHGAPGRGAKARGDFKPNDSTQAIERAREVVDGLRELIGIEPGLPLGQPSARTGPVSAQVSFAETLDGIPLEPVGAVSVDLGPQGEILNVTSNYVSPLPVVNQRSLAVEQAKAKAEAAVPEPNSSLSTLGGGAIVWVTHTGPAGAALGHQAYEFNVAGRQVIVDAGNGEVLFKRDRRQF